MKNKQYIAFILLLISILLVGCGIRHSVVSTPEPTEIPIPTASPFPITPSPFPTIIPTQAPSPSPVLSPSPSPVITTFLFPTITKNPTDEVVEEGGECYFIAKYENATIAVWHFVSPDGQTDLTYIGAQENFKPVEILNGMYSDLHLKNIPYSLNGWRVYCKYSNENGSVITKSALITVIPAPVPTPTVAPIEEVTPTPEIIYTPSPDTTEILKNEFQEESTAWVEAILKEYQEAEEVAKEKEEEFINENYLTNYEIDVDTFTLTLTYNVTEQMLQDIIDNINVKRVKDKTEITLSESAAELLQINLDDIQDIQHCILILINNDEEYYQVDLITKEILYIRDEKKELEE